MAVSTDGRPRRRRYTRQPLEGLLVLTPPKVALLEYIARYGIVSLPQLARLTGLSPKAARKHLRALFDRGLVEVIAVPRVALVEPARGLNDPSLLYGSAPNLYQITRAGGRALGEMGLVADAPVKSERYGPRNWLFLAHELLIRDVRVWFELSSRAHADHELAVWRDGAAAAIDLDDSGGGPQLYPDAWLVYRFGERRLVALLEVDRGTERGDGRWGEKLARYAALFQEGRLKAAIGYRKARVLVITPDQRRRDQLAASIAEQAAPELAARFWLAGRARLGGGEVHHAGWRQPDNPHLQPLLPPEPPNEGRLRTAPCEGVDSASHGAAGAAIP